MPPSSVLEKKSAAEVRPNLIIDLGDDDEAAAAVVRELF
jgi:hypothetical protein